MLSLGSWRITCKLLPQKRRLGSNLVAKLDALDHLKG